MSETLITITDAATLSGKSIQTIRRAIKAKKIRVKKQKTPQGFNYLIVKDTLLTCYQVRESSPFREIPIEPRFAERNEQDGMESSQVTSSSVAHDTSDSTSRDASDDAVRLDIQATPATKELDVLAREQVKIALNASQKATLAIQQLDEKVASVISSYAGEREQVSQVLTEFKDRILILENQLRLLQAPKKKWYHLW